MDFKDKMSNVSFGGNWSEELVEANKARDILMNLEWAVENCTQRDVDTAAVQASLEYVEHHADKGPMLVAKWRRGYAIEIQTIRQKHFEDSYRLIVDYMGL